MQETTTLHAVPREGSGEEMTTQDFSMPDDYDIYNMKEATTELNIDEETTKLTATPDIPSSTTGPAPTSSPAPTPSPPSELPDGMIAWAPYSNYSGFGGSKLCC